MERACLVVHNNGLVEFPYFSTNLEENDHFDDENLSPLRMAFSIVNDENVKNTRKILEVFISVDGDGSKY